MRMMSAPAEGFGRRYLVALAAACLLLTVALYYPTLGFGFVGDDVWFVRPNPDWLRDAFFPTHSWHFYPLNQVLLYGLAAVSGWRPEAMHAVNLLLHAGIGFGLALWLGRVGLDRRVGAFAALFFIARGISYEVVAWITELSYLMVVVFTLLTFAWWDRHLRGAGTRYLVWTVAGFAAALLIIEHALVLIPLYFLYELLVRPGPSAWLPRSGDSHRDWGEWLRRVARGALRYVPLVLVAVAFLGVRATLEHGLTMGSMGDGVVQTPAPIPSGMEASGELPPERTWHGILNTPARAYEDLLLTASYLFFPTAGCFGAEDTWLTRHPWLFLLPWLAMHVWVLWKGRPIARFLLLWVYVYMLPLALFSVPQARYYYMATLPAAGLVAIGLVSLWDRLARRVPARALAVAAVVGLGAVAYGEAAFIRMGLREWKLGSDLVRQATRMLEHDLDGGVKQVYLVNFPRVVPSRFFPADGFANAAEYLNFMLRPPRRDVTVEPVYDRSFVAGDWPTIGRYLAREEVDARIQGPRAMAYEFIGRSPWIVRLP